MSDTTITYITTKFNEQKGVLDHLKPTKPQDYFKLAEAWFAMVVFTGVGMEIVPIPSPHEKVVGAYLIYIGVGGEAVVQVIDYAYGKLSGGESDAPPSRPGAGKGAGTGSGTHGDTGTSSPDSGRGSVSGSETKGSGDRPQRDDTHPHDGPPDNPLPPNDIEVQGEGQDATWYEPSTGKSGGVNDKTPNPEDPRGGSGEGIDKEWWRKLPGRSVDDLLAELTKAVKVDDQEGTMTIDLKRAGAIATYLAEKPIKTDEGGEGITLDLSVVHTSGMSAGTSSREDLGDGPRSLAEAVALPRMRTGDTISIRVVPRTHSR
jgi:hypothetical protein